MILAKHGTVLRLPATPRVDQAVRQTLSPQTICGSESAPATTHAGACADDMIAV